MRLLKPLATLALETSGISSYVLITETAQALHIRSGAAVAMLS